MENHSENFSWSSLKYAVSALEYENRTINRIKQHVFRKRRKSGELNVAVESHESQGGQIRQFC